jgi:release factor glutamine methyltransferase
VTGFEPGIALFTPEDDPLLFYRALHRLASVFLVPGGYLFLEVHERYARETLRLFMDESFTQPELRSDLSGKPRMIRVRKSSA